MFFKNNKDVMNAIKPIQYSKKMVFVILMMAFVFSVFGYYTNLQYGNSINEIITQWIEFAKWICGLYLAKSFAETYAEERNNLKRESLQTEYKDITDNSYEDVEI